MAGQPSDLHTGIASWTITFRQDHTWRYDGVLSGPLSGMHVDGSGSWRVRGRTLVYTAGSSSGTSVVTMAHDELTLTPDPVLALPATGKPVETTYRRNLRP